LLLQSWYDPAHKKSDSPDLGDLCDLRERYFGSGLRFVHHTSHRSSGLRTIGEPALH
jgi:hypothetical protein